MNRSFDKILIRRIREVFDNHSEAVDPAAWKDMQEKLDGGRNLRIVYLQRASRVAAVLLLLFLVFWPFNQQIKEYSERNETLMNQYELPSPDFQENMEFAESDSKGIASVENSGEQQSESQPQRRLIGQDDHNEMIQNETGKKEGISKKTAATSKEKDDLQKISPLQRRVDVAQNQQPYLAALSESGEQKSPWEQISSGNLETDKKQKANLGVTFSTLYNYTPKATKSDLNFSGGVLSEFELLPNLSMHTGVIVSRQYFTTHGSTIPEGNDALYSHLSAESTSSSANVTSTSNRVELVGLDVPVNIRYRYRDFSLTAGISSFTYIQEQYSHHYSAEYVNYIYDESNNLRNTEKVIRSQSVEESYDPLHQVDLANILNLSLGYHFTFDRSQMVVEPYLKHPLSDLTSQDIRFGARGIRLKFQF